SLGFRSKFPEIQIKLYARERDGYDREEDLLEAVSYLRGRLGQVIFSESGQSMQEVVGELLRQNQACLALAESCTGGLMANWMTNVAGSSEYFLFSGVTYSNRAKVDILGVSEDTLRIYGAVHEQTAREMAEGVKGISGADYGLVTTGISGPGGGSPEKPVGTVCIGLSTPEETLAKRYNFPFDNRLANKKIFAMTALDILRKHLLLSE
ncbi:MAG TPA: nicotinamide-nucleotide amidohydrolase family protein, partial [Desulfohalobiaceae bacterium]|nr:nicotinamide-nucleotide amidohydrolase family protein [Desulfohalobiaceae bacterium]